MYFKQLTSLCTMALSIAINVTGQDKIPPKITIDEDQISANFPLGDPGLDWQYKILKTDTIAIELSCLYSFPDEYYLKIENVIIEDDSGILKDTIIVDDIIFDEMGYGKLIQTILAEDNSGNISRLVFISEFSKSEYLFDVLGIKVGEIEVLNNDFPFALEKTNFELCDAKNLNIKLLYSKNGCTGGTRIDWYINNERVKINSDNISVDISNEPDGIELAAEGKYSNTNFQDRVKINIQKISNQGIIEKYDPTCLNSDDGIINIDPNASDIKWEHNNSNASFLNSLKAGSYYVSYTYNGCEFNDTITLSPKNILDFVGFGYNC